jgi:hypothetical protein
MPDLSHFVVYWDRQLDGNMITGPLPRSINQLSLLRQVAFGGEFSSMTPGPAFRFDQCAGLRTL